MPIQYEIWKSIDGYEGRYEVSSFGRMKSLSKYINTSPSNKKGFYTKNRILAPSVCRFGYQIVCLRKNGIAKVFKVHRLVAFAFIPMAISDGKPQINHIDGDKLNNNVWNLEWCNNSENQLHSYRILNKRPTWENKKRGQMSDEQKARISLSKRTVNAHEKIILNKETGIYYDTLMEAAMAINMNKRTFSAMLSGQNKNRTQFEYF